MTLRKILLLLILPLSLAASAAKPESATAVLARCAARVNSARSLSARFNLTAGPNSYPCSMTLAKQKFVLDTPQMKVWYDGATQWVYDTSAQRLSITEPTADELLETNPFAILNHYSRSYTCRLLKSSPGTRAVELTPKTPATASVRSAVVTVSDKTDLPSRIVVTLTDGSTLSASLVKAEMGKAMPASAFVYDKAKYKATEIIDLR